MIRVEEARGVIWTIDEMSIDSRVFFEKAFAHRDAKLMKHVDTLLISND